MADLAGTLRLDRFLWFARIVKTRGSAQRVASSGRLRIDGRAIERPATPVRIGNVLTFAQANRVRILRIEGIPTRRGPAEEARACYTDLSPPDANVSQNRREY